MLRLRPAGSIDVVKSRPRLGRVAGPCQAVGVRQSVPHLPVRETEASRNRIEFDAIKR